GLDVFRGDDDVRHGNAGRCKTTPCQRHRGRCDNAPAVGGKGGEEADGSGDRHDAVDVLDLAAFDFLGFRLDINTRQRKAADRVDAAHAVHGRQEGLDVEAVALRPGAPDAFRGGDGVDDGSVHVEQEGGEA